MSSSIAKAPLYRRLSPVITISLLATLLNGCGLMQSQDGEGEQLDGPVLQTIGDLKLAPKVEAPQNVTLSLDDVIANYSEAEQLAKDPKAKAEVRYRLAHLLMQKSQQEFNEQSDNVALNEPIANQESANVALEQKHRKKAISAYQSLLNDYPDHPENDQVLYQLAKSHELNGDQDAALATMDRLVKQHPDSDHYLESQFRRGEIYFSYGDYEMAEQAFADVMKGGETSRFYRTAASMHGWSLFKREQFDASLKSFIVTLDHALPPGVEYEDLSVAEQTLIDDQLRVMGFVFSYMGGVDSISQLFEEVGHRDYEYLVYQRVAEKLTEQERYSDTIDTYKRFISLYPVDSHAPLFQERVINVSITAGLVESIVPEKTRFVEQYGIASKYWSKFYGTPYIEFPKARLRVYLDELSNYYHSVARKQQKQQRNQQQVSLNYEKASHFYQAFADTFPTDPKSNEMVFLLGESLFESGRYEAAINAYEKVAYAAIPDPVTGAGYSNSAEAGYAAIVTYDKQLQGVKPEQAEGWKQRQLDSSLRFANVFPRDPRAPQVQLRSISYLYDHQRYDEAIVEAKKLIDWQPALEAKVRLDAWLIVANSEFKLQKYVEAEQSLVKVSQLMPKNDQRYPEIIELLAVSIYRQGEMLVAKGELRLAIEEFYRVGRVAPHSPIAVSADIDAASYLMQIEAWSEAIGLLNRFRQQHPKDPFVADIPVKLTYAYEKTEQWALAARELYWISNNTSDEEEKRLALHQSASYYAKAGVTSEAISMFKRYAHRYETPLDLLMEAQFTLSEMYLEGNEPEKRRYWLKKIIKTYDSNESKGLTNDRMTYLAAMSSSVLAQDYFEAFTQVKLTLPLKKSLKKKKALLKRTLAQYEKTAGYGVEEFTTSATYHIGKIYSGFSKDLFASERPKNLNELALEQYDILLEEQAYPFEEQAIEIHEINAQRSWTGTYDQWVKDSFTELKTLYPSRYKKEETKVLFSEQIL